MNKRGFTLIELLAVIVILAIIAVIAVPIVLNIIDESKESASLRSAEMYLDATEMVIADRVMHHGTINAGLYPIMSNGNICLKEYKKEGTPKIETCGGKPLAEVKKEDILEVEVKGEKPTSGSIYIKGGQIFKEIDEEASNKKTILVIGGNMIEPIKGEDGTIKFGIADTNNGNGDTPNQTVKLCTANTTKAKALVYNSGDAGDQNSYNDNVEVGLIASTDGAYTPGVAYTCNFIDNNEANNMTFFVLSSTEDTVTLIAGFNLKALTGEVHTVAWSAEGNNHKDDPEEEQAVTAKAALAKRTANWSSANGGKLSEEQMSTIKLPTAYQIVEVIGQTFSGSSISGLPTWLNSYTKTPIAYGYWTSTPNAENSYSAWYVYYNGNVNDRGVGVVSVYGVRPVITISKSNV